MYIVSNVLMICSKINLDVKEAERRGVAREREREGLAALLLIKGTDAGAHEEHLSNIGVNVSHSGRKANILS
jgi:hypothetical protein